MKLLQPDVIEHFFLKSTNQNFYVHIYITELLHNTGAVLSKQVRAVLIETLQKNLVKTTTVCFTARVIRWCAGNTVK